MVGDIRIDLSGVNFRAAAIGAAASEGCRACCVDAACIGALVDVRSARWSALGQFTRMLGLLREQSQMRPLHCHVLHRARNGAVARLTGARN